MTTFAAKEREITAPAVPSGPPQCDLGALAYADALSTVEYQTFTYATRTHTLRDVLRPGYFDNAAHPMGNLRLWSKIHATVGSDPAEATEVFLRVISMPGHSRMTKAERDEHAKLGPRGEHLCVALLARWKPSAVAHDGEPVDDTKSPTSNRKAA